MVSYLCREYALVHGPGSLAPRRKEGFSRRHLCQMLEAMRTRDLPLRSRQFPILTRDSWLSQNVAAVLAVSSSGGFRKAEVSLPAQAAFSSMHMSRASLFWVLGGTLW